MMPPAFQIPAGPCDVLALGAHPDDAELFAGGTLALLARRGLRVAVVALTQGEMGSRGSVAERAVEAANAARVLGVEAGTLGLPDGAIADVQEQRLVVAQALRLLRPRLLLTHAPEGRHPDHDGAHALVRAARFVANMARASLSGDRHHVSRTLHFPSNDASWPAPPSLVVTYGEDIFQLKLDALRCYSTQFAGGVAATPASAASPPATLIASPEFWRHIETRARFYAVQSGGGPGHDPYAEPFLTDGPQVYRSAEGLLS